MSCERPAPGTYALPGPRSTGPRHDRLTAAATEGRDDRMPAHLALPWRVAHGLGPASPRSATSVALVPHVRAELPRRHLAHRGHQHCGLRVGLSRAEAVLDQPRNGCEGSVRPPAPDDVEVDVFAVADGYIPEMFWMSQREDR